jgi:hypothetical protein
MLVTKHSTDELCTNSFSATIDAGINLQSNRSHERMTTPQWHKIVATFLSTITHSLGWDPPNNKSIDYQAILYKM